MSSSKTQLLASLMAATYLISGCGGGDTTAPSPTASAPAPVTATPPPPPAVNITTASTGTGAFGVLGTQNARVAFIPAGTTILPIVLENNGTQTIAKLQSDSLQAVSTKPAVSLTFNVDACTVDSDALKAICIGYNSSKIATMDLKTFATSFKVADIALSEFDTKITSTRSFSGGSCYVCGVSSDIGKNRYVISTKLGYTVYNYASSTPAATYSLAIGENFALLPQAGASSYLIAPEYETNSGKRKLNVVNLDSGKTYAWTKATDSVTDLGTNSTGFQYAEIDAAAVDLQTGMIVLSNEDNADMLLIDFKQSSFNDTSLTFAAPHQIRRPSGYPSRQTDVAVTSSGNLLLTHEEFGATIGVMQLPSSSGTSGLFPATTSTTSTLGIINLNDSLLSTSMTSACGVTYFSGKGDPHGLSLYTSTDASAKGLIVNNNNTCAAIVDLKGLSTAARKTGSNADYIDLSLTSTAAMIKFVKLQ